jgi:hypothetical protein
MTICTTVAIFGLALNSLIINELNRNKDGSKLIHI